MRDVECGWGTNKMSNISASELDSSGLSAFLSAFATKALEITDSPIKIIVLVLLIALLVFALIAKPEILKLKLAKPLVYFVISILTLGIIFAIYAYFFPPKPNPTDMVLSCVKRDRSKQSETLLSDFYKILLESQPVFYSWADENAVTQKNKIDDIVLDKQNSRVVLRYNQSRDELALYSVEAKDNQSQKFSDFDAVWQRGEFQGCGTFSVTLPSYITTGSWSTSPSGRVRSAKLGLTIRVLAVAENDQTDNSNRSGRINRPFFFDRIQTELHRTFQSRQIKTLDRIFDYWEQNHREKDDRMLAYILSTIDYESAGSLMPLEEFGKGAGQEWGQVDEKGNAYYGRGFLQITRKEAYEKISSEVGIDLVSNPNLALDLDVSIKIAVEGMLDGWFTGKSLANYFNKTTEDWVGARKIVNGLNKSVIIAAHARQFYSAISYTN
jgi:putative chitinase